LLRRHIPGGEYKKSSTAVREAERSAIDDAIGPSISRLLDLPKEPSYSNTTV
jgi:hypothetical protein